MDYKTPKISEGTVFVPSILSVVKTRDLKIESDCKFPLSSVSYIDQEWRFLRVAALIYFL